MVALLRQEMVLYLAPAKHYAVQNRYLGLGKAKGWRVAAPVAGDRITQDR